MAIEIKTSGNLRYHRPGVGEGILSGPTCALDIADEGPKTLDEVGKFFGLTRERVRQILSVALEKAQKPSREALEYKEGERVRLPIFAQPRGA